MLIFNFKKDEIRSDKLTRSKIERKTNKTNIAKMKQNNKKQLIK